MRKIGGVYCELAPVEKAQLKEFLVIRILKMSANPGVTSLTKHQINVDLHSPIKQHCLVSPKVQEAIHEEVHKMLAAVIIELSCSK